MTPKDKVRVVLARDLLRGYEKLERKEVDRAGWLALKFSCSREEAERIVALVDGA